MSKDLLIKHLNDQLNDCKRQLLEAQIVIGYYATNDNWGFCPKTANKTCIEYEDHTEPEDNGHSYGGRLAKEYMLRNIKVD